MKFCIMSNWRMANTMVTIIFQNSYATPLIRLSLRVIRSLVLYKFCIVTNWRMAITKMAFIFQMHYVTPIIRLLIGVISDVNYLSDLNEIFYSDQSKDGEYNGDNYFSKF